VNSRFGSQIFELDEEVLSRSFGRPEQFTIFFGDNLLFITKEAALQGADSNKRASEERRLQGLEEKP